MSIKPIDYQIMLPRTTEVSKISNDEHNRHNSLQQTQNAQIQHKTEDSLRQVYSQDKANGAIIRERREKEQGQKKKDQGKDKESQKQGKDEDKSIQTSTIDIRI